MADVTGQRGTLNVNQAQRRIDIDPTIKLLEPDATPLVVLTNLLNKRKTSDPKYSWFEDVSDPRFDTQNGGATSSATTVGVTNGPYYAEHQIWKNTRTGEVIRIQAVNGNNVTAVRGVGNSGTGVAMLNGDELLLIGWAQPEGDKSAPARSNNPTQVSNFTQILRKPIDATRTQMQSDQFTDPNDFVYQHRKVAIEHKKDLEYTFWHSKANEDTSAAQPRRTTAGALSRISTNVTVVGGALTEATFNGGLVAGFRYGSGRKLGFGSGKAMQALNGFASGKLHVVQGAQEYGLNIERYISPFGTIDLTYARLLEGSAYGGYFAIIDPENLAYRYLSNENGSSDMHVRTNIQDPDVDGQKDEFLTEAGLQFPEEKKMALYTGITG
jgi:uncharacterized protein DUF5309